MSLQFAAVTPLTMIDRCQALKIMKPGVLNRNSLNSKGINGAKVSSAFRASKAGRCADAIEVMHQIASIRAGERGFVSTEEVNKPRTMMKLRFQYLLAAAVFANCLSAHAELGSAPSYSAATNASAIQAVKRMSAMAVPYTVSEATLAGGTLVREYVGQSGTVFAVSWNGPHTPDLSSLLGNYFPGYLETVNQQHAQQGSAFGPATVERSDVVVQTGGHMGAYVGRAWLPSALPAGVSIDDIQ